ncbi:hypothetical protein HPB50_020205 [Hyalomma asiaticum]|uniref:Uncharacterized protein n=1 Tax=Hyalomma asiaticum TaxID=266040 RepID=A0ACB7T923_HYAAI|nr:hypothetical protein HPB50_020205 [Hyalomma asiaticum]
MPGPRYGRTPTCVVALLLTRSERGHFLPWAGYDLVPSRSGPTRHRTSGHRKHFVFGEPSWTFSGKEKDRAAILSEVTSGPLHFDEDENPGPQPP